MYTGCVTVCKAWLSFDPCGPFPPPPFPILLQPLCPSTRLLARANVGKGSHLSHGRGKSRSKWPMQHSMAVYKR